MDAGRGRASQEKSIVEAAGRGRTRVTKEQSRMEVGRQG
jgi:hypothetical protein